ncbi:hypothetical protein HHJ78_10780 [Mobiluncus mulieris]|uniref:Uncharacterized protein n=1 Tax=Mobiluncus mulieris TaxID=2052 RepID=A0A7Y0U3V7_9ACTO|nr:hypothetical protein [Mobiluncus mulieris]NMW65968.1 hypothetical protein [Mobiluncus mulieris]
MNTNKFIKAILIVTANNLPEEYAPIADAMLAADTENWSKDQAGDILDLAEEIRDRIIKTETEEAAEGLIDELEIFRAKGFVQAKYINGGDQWQQILRAITNCNAVHDGEYDGNLIFLLENLSLEDVTTGEYVEEFEELLLRDFRWTVDIGRISRKYKLHNGTAEEVQELQEKAAEIKASVDAKIAGGKAVWRKLNGGWVIYGKNLVEGTNVVVEKKSGEKKTVGVLEIVKSDGDCAWATTRKPW